MVRTFSLRALFVLLTVAAMLVWHLQSRDNYCLTLRNNLWRNLLEPGDKILLYRVEGDEYHEICGPMVVRQIERRAASDLITIGVSSEQWRDIFWTETRHELGFSLRYDDNVSLLNSQRRITTR